MSLSHLEIGFCSFSMHIALVKLAASLVAPLLLLEGPILPNRDQQSSAIRIPEAISKLHPLPQEELFTAYSRGNSYLVEGRFEDALSSLDLAEEINKDASDVYLTRGIVNEKLLRWDDALRDYNKAREIQKKKALFGREDPTIISNIANAETGLLMWDDALRDFSLSSKMDGDFMAPKIGKALVLYELDRKKEGLTIIKQILDRYPDTFTDGMCAVAVMNYGMNPEMDGEELERNVALLNDAVTQDSRYSDLEWVRDIRRWPPSLVSALEALQKRGSVR